MSTLVVSNISDGTTTVGASYVTNGSAKAWVNFNGQGTIAARDSLNLSSLTDVAVGKFTINISSAMANTTYAVNSSCADTSTSDQAANSGSANLSPNYTTSSFSHVTSNFSGTLQDKAYNFAAVLGDLA